MSKILITGAKGFIGQHLAKALAENGHAVAGIGHGIWPEEEALASGVSVWLNSDVTLAGLELAQRAFGGFHVIYHLAGGSSVGASMTAPREDFCRTVGSTADLLEWVRLISPETAVVVASSAAVYGAGHDGCIPEHASLTPHSPYGTHKRFMEDLCRSYGANYGIKCAIARLFSIYGPGLKKQLIWDLCHRLAKDKQEVWLGGSGGELRDWTHITDVVRALMHLLGAPTEDVPIFNLGTGVGTTVKQIAIHVAAVWADSQSPATVRFSGESRAGDPFSLVADVSKLNSTGFCAKTNFESGLGDYVAWFRSSILPQNPTASSANSLR